MAKKKLSRDQKRKQKKQKRNKQPKQRVGWGQKRVTRVPVKPVDPVDPVEMEVRMAAAAADYEKQEKRIQAVFGAAEDDVPEVTEDTLQIYFEHLRDHLPVPCRLTGIESMGYFGWEERYSFGYGSKAEYQRLRQEQASYRDEYELPTFAATVDMDWEDIVVDVRRTADGKAFSIPLSELQAVDEAAVHYQLLNDYSVWYVNWR